jgi:hypothetical protein
LLQDYIQYVCVSKYQVQFASILVFIHACSEVSLSYARVPACMSHSMCIDFMLQ